MAAVGLLHADGPTCALSTWERLLFVDVSGSVGGSDLYFNTLRTIAARFQPTRIILWCHEIHKLVSMRDLNAWCARKSGVGGTASSCIAQWLATHPIPRAAAGCDTKSSVCIVTDGEVGGDEVTKADRILARAPIMSTFKHVDVYLVNRNERSVNMSVSSSFTRDTPHKVTYIGSEHAETHRVDVNVTQEDLDLVADLDAIRTVAEFQAKYDAIHRVFVARTMGTSDDAPLRERLLQLKRRLVRAMATGGGAASADTPLDAALRVENWSAAEDAVRTMCSASAAAAGSDFERQMSVLLAFTQGALRSAFTMSDVASQRVAFAASARADGDAPQAAADAPPADAMPFVCPITLDDASSNVVLLLKMTAPTADAEADTLLAPRVQPVLAGVDKSIVNGIFDCPLMLLSRAGTPVLAKLLARLDHPVSLEAYRDLREEGVVRSPMTRAHVMTSALCLGGAADHAAATDAALFQLTSGGKVLGNANLWYAAIVLGLYAALREGDLGERMAACIKDSDAEWAALRLEYLRPLLPQLRAHLQWRLTHAKSYASLSGLANTVTTQVSLGAAAWFCTGGALVQNEVMPKREAARAHLGYLPAVLALVELAGYRVSPAASEHLMRLQVFARMLRRVKKQNSALPLQLTVRALIQNAIPVRKSALARELRATLQWVPPFVMLDGPASELQVAAVRASLPPLIRDMPVSLLLRLAEVAHPSKAFGDVDVAERALPAVSTEHTVRWPSLMGAVAPLVVEIVPTTMRPRYRLANGHTWEQEAHVVYGEGPLFSSTRAYAEYASRFGIWPDLLSWLVWLYVRKCGGTVGNNLPRHIVQFFKEDECAFKAGAGERALPDLIQLYRQSVSIERRMALERRVLIAVPPTLPADAVTAAEHDAAPWDTLLRALMERPDSVDEETE